MAHLQPTARTVAGRVLSIIGAVFLVIGASGLAAAGVLALREAHSGRTAHAEGVIVRADYRALIAFKTADGEAVQFRNSVGSSFGDEGDHVAVAYDPANPRHAAVDAFVGRWFLPGLFTIVFGVFFAIGLSLGLTGLLLRRRTDAPLPQIVS